MMRHTSCPGSASSSWFHIFLCIETTLFLLTFTLVNAFPLPKSSLSSSQLEARSNVQHRSESGLHHKGLSTAGKALIAVCWIFAFVACLCLWAFFDIWKQGRFGRWVRPARSASVAAVSDDSLSDCGEAQRIRSTTGRPPRSLLASECGSSRDDLTKVGCTLEAMPVLQKESRWFRRTTPAEQPWAGLEAHGLGTEYTIQRSLDATTYPLPLGSPTATATTSDKRRLSSISHARLSWIWVTETATSSSEQPSRNGTISSNVVSLGHRGTVSSTIASLGHRGIMIPQAQIEPEAESLSLSTSTLVPLTAHPLLIPPVTADFSSPSQRPILSIQTMFPEQAPPQRLSPPQPLRLNTRKSRTLGPRDRRSRA